jgi:D-3-phosphoglycerate dehydrogenase
MRVLVADNLESAGLDLLRRAGLEVDARAGLTGDELKRALQAAEGVIVRSGARITAAMLDPPGKLKAIVRAGVGVDNIDLAAATRRGIVVMNTPGGNTLSTAEQTLALLLALVRHTPAAVSSVKAGRWERGMFTGTQLAGKTLGIIGLGRIGREVAKRALGLDMHVIGYDPMLPTERVAALGIEPAPDLDAVLVHCDVLTVHVPFTDQTKGMIGMKELARMKKGARVINCARGGIIDETALAEALTSGHLAGAGIDVFEEEPPPKDHPLLALPNLICTPHLGASTSEAQRSVALEAAQLMVDFLLKGRIQAAVNMTPYERAELLELRPELDVAYRLGLLLSQLQEGALRRLVLSLNGELADRNPRLLTPAFLIGLIAQRLDEPVNLVNVDLLARERGIEIEVRQSKTQGDFRSMLRAEVETAGAKLQAAATLFGKAYPRLVQLGPYPLESYLDGNLLIMTHHDRPGLIGHIGVIFGRHEVNIAQMVVGRQTPGGEAIAVLNLDSIPPLEALAEVTKHPAIRSLQIIKLPPRGDLPTWLA